MHSGFQLRSLEVGASPTNRVVGGAAFLALALLAGCSSSTPSASDVEKAWNEAYGCPALEVRNVKKLDGRPGPQGSYSTEFSYSVAIKGGDATAGKLLTDYLYVQSELDAVKQALLIRLPKPASDPQVMALKAYNGQLAARLEQLGPCGSPDFASMLEITQQALNTKAPTIAVPVAAQVRRSNGMERSESGWHLNMMVSVIHSFDVQSSKPMQLAMPPSKVPGLLGEAGAGAATNAERTLTGTLRIGQTDSCFGVPGGGDEKCYALPGDPVQAKRILDACKDGEQCRITGEFNDKAESLGAFSKVEKVAP